MNRSLPNRVFIGIDPGLSGALSVLKEEHGDKAEFVEVQDMPKQAKRSGKNEVDTQALIAWCEELYERVHNPIQPPHIYVIVEQVTARPGQGVSSMFTFGDAYGCARMVGGFFANYGGQYCAVAPASWKKRMGVTQNKSYSRTLALRAFPKASEQLKRKKDEGRAEAILLALYGYQNRNTLFA